MPSQPTRQQRRNEKRRLRKLHRQQQRSAMHSTRAGQRTLLRTGRLHLLVLSLKRRFATSGRAPG